MTTPGDRHAPGRVLRPLSRRRRSGLGGVRFQRALRRCGAGFQRASPLRGVRFQRAKAAHRDSSARRRRTPRAGFTLLEVTLTLTVLVVVVSLVWPAVIGYLREQTLREQAQLIRSELAKTRGKAIESGLTYQFRFEPGGRKFVVLPADRPDVGSGSTGDSAPTVTTSVAAGTRVPVTSGKLPERCLFEFPIIRSSITGSDAPTTTEQLPQEWLALLPDGVTLAQTAWAPAIRFFSDGTSDDASITILDEIEQKIQITVRGFTGGVSTGPLLQDTGP